MSTERCGQKGRCKCRRITAVRKNTKKVQEEEKKERKGI